MRPADIPLFLIGNRGAIERLAATRHAWVTGAILVLTAGIARNYDHLDLLYQPEWFIGPFAASLVSIGFIFLCLTTTLFYSDENWKTLEREHPDILNAVQKYADELRSRSELLSNDESRWLSRYESTTHPPAPPGP